MKTSTLLILTGVVGLAYLIKKTNFSRKAKNKPGILSEFVNGIADEIKKPLPEVAKDVPANT